MVSALCVTLTILLQLILRSTANPKVKLSPAKPLFRVGDRQELKCQISQCSGKAVFSWRSVEDKPLYSEVQTSSNESILVFRSVNKNHETMILCRTTCQGEFREAKAKVRVYSFPKDPVISGHQSLVLGKENTLSCELSDVYPAQHFTVEWLRGHKVVHTQTIEHHDVELIQSNYTFTPQTNNMNESITCRATLTLDGLPPESRTRETTVPVTVQSFPSDPIIKSSGPFLEGKVTNLTCTVRDVFPADCFQIYLIDGETVLHSVRGNFSDKLQNLTLTIPVIPKDSDQNKMFTCKVSLEMEGVSSQKTASTTLTLNYSPKHTTIDVKPQKKLNEGETVTISCQTDSAPEGQVTLKRVQNGEDTKLVSSNGTQISFKIPFINVSHAGIYVCEAANKYGYQEDNVQITVQAFPSDPIIKSSGPFLEGKGTNLTCTVHDVFPADCFQIYLIDGETVLHSVRGNFSDKLQNLTLTIPVIPKDSDQNKTFTCKVSLEMEGVSSQKTASTTLALNSPPRNMTVMVYPSNEVQEGENITICCQLISFPQANITLMKLDNGNEIDSFNGIFPLVNLTSNDSGRYQVNATNALGSKIEIFTINVRSKNKDDENTSSSHLPRLNFTDFIIPVIGLGILAIVVTSLGCIKIAKKKDAYELTESIPEIV